MSHTTIAVTRDYVNGASHGELMAPMNKDYEVDPMLSSIKTSQLPHKILPDPAPSTDPGMFDPSTGHPHSHYDHQKQLSKKKRAKKYGVGSAMPAKTNRVGNTLSDKQHSRDKIDHEKRRDLTFEERDLMAHREQPKEGDEGEEEEEEEEESSDEAELTESAQQNEEQRMAHREQRKGMGVHDKHPTHVQHAFKPERKPLSKAEDATIDEAMKKGATPSLLARASNLASSLTSKVTETLSAAKDKVMGAKSDEGEQSEGDKNKDKDEGNKEEGEKSSQ